MSPDVDPGPPHSLPRRRRLRSSADGPLSHVRRVQQSNVFGIVGLPTELTAARVTTVRPPPMSSPANKVSWTGKPALCRQHYSMFGNATWRDGKPRR